MKIKAIRWMDDQGDEAEVIITGDLCECVAFCYPCRLKVGEELREPLHAEGEDFLIPENSFSCITKSKIGGYFAYDCIGQVTDFEKSIVSVGGILIKLFNMPGWAQEGGFLEFHCDRLDARNN